MWRSGRYPILPFYINDYRRLRWNPVHCSCCIRSYSTSSKNYNNHHGHPTTTTSTSCPYQILQIPVGADYETTRRAFIQKVKIHHPDNGGTTHEFIRVRAAFEAIVDGKPFDVNNPSSKNNDETNKEEKREFYHHYEESTTSMRQRHRTTALDFLEFELTEQTRQEIIHVYRRNCSSHHANGNDDGGAHHNYLNDKGGLWEMARQLSERDERGIDQPIPSKIFLEIPLVDASEDSNNDKQQSIHI